MTQRELACATGFDRNTIICYENNIHHCGLAECSKIAAALEIEPEFLYDDYLFFISDGCGTKIKSLRKQLNLSQQSFGQLLKTSKKTVGRWERGQNIPLRDNVEMLLQLIATRDTLI